MRSKRKSSVLGGTGLLVLALIAAYLLLPKPLGYHAEAFDRSFREGDVNGLFAYANPIETEQAGLTRRNFEAFYDQIIRPRFSGLKLVRHETEVMADGGQAVTRGFYKLSDGRSFQTLTMIWPTDSGPKAHLIRNLLVMSWRLDDRKTNPTMSDAEWLKRWTETQIRYLERDRPYLEALGIKGIAAITSTGVRFGTWDEWLEAMRKRSQQEKEIEREQAEKLKAGEPPR